MATDDARNAELLFGEPADHEVVLVVAGRGDDHVHAAEVGRGEVGVFARVGAITLTPGNMALRRSAVVETCSSKVDVVMTVHEVLRNRHADRSPPAIITLIVVRSR